MRYALVNDERREAGRGLSGKCPYCKSSVVPKCGEIRFPYWSHRGRRICDSWKNKTDWHYGWQDKFPESWQEVVHLGEKRHVADVKTEKGYFLEFQYSFLPPDERRSRDSFYEKLVWVVNGEKRQTYRSQFFEALEEVNPINRNPVVREVLLGDCALLQEWAGCRAPVFFDFGEETPLWCLVPTNQEMCVYVAEFTRTDFIELHRGETTRTIQSFAEHMIQLDNIVSRYISNRTQAFNQSVPLLKGFRQYLARERSRKNNRC